MREWNYERVDGRVRGPERFQAIRNFSEKDTFAFLLSTRSGGEDMLRKKFLRKFRTRIEFDGG